MDEVGYEVVLGDVLEAEATDICRKEVKLHGQRIRRAAAKAVVPDEVLPAAPEECPDCIAWHRAWDEREAMWGDRKKMWEDDREQAQRELRLKDREIAHLTDRASHRRGRRAAQVRLKMGGCDSSHRQRGRSARRAIAIEIARLRSKSE